MSFLYFLSYIYVERIIHIFCSCIQFDFVKSLILFTELLFHFNVKHCGIYEIWEMLLGASCTCFIMKRKASDFVKSQWANSVDCCFCFLSFDISNWELQCWKTWSLQGWKLWQIFTFTVKSHHSKYLAPLSSQPSVDKCLIIYIYLVILDRDFFLSFFL